MAIQNSICSPEFSGGVNMVSYVHISFPFPIQVLQLWYHIFTETPSKVTNPKLRV